MRILVWLVKLPCSVGNRGGGGESGLRGGMDGLVSQIECKVGVFAVLVLCMF